MPYVEGDVDDAGQLVQRDHVRPVGRRAVWIGMRFEEEAVGPRGGRGVEQRRDEVAQAAARALGSLPPLLPRVRAVVHDPRPTSAPEPGGGAPVGPEGALAAGSA